MGEIKRAFVFRGPGFYRERGIDESLKALGFAVHYCVMVPGQALSLDSQIGAADLLLLRGDWDAISEELLYARSLGNKLVAIGKNLLAMPEASRPTVIASGRWAVAALFAEWTTLRKSEVSRLAWISLPDELRGPWINVKVSHSQASYYARLLGRVVPDFSGTDLVTSLVGPSSLGVGWRSAQNLHLFFADPLAFSDGSQLEGFGYENHEDLKNNTAFLMSLLGERDATRI
jgi:hypothetical protein